MSRRGTFVGLAFACLFVLLFHSAATAVVVGEVGVEGNLSVSRDRILLSFGARIGEELSVDGVRAGIRRLYDMGTFSDIQVEAEEREDGTLRLTIVVEERPRVSLVEFTGNDKVKDGDIESALRVRKDTPYDSGSVEDSRVSLLKLYESKGFPGAAVKATAEESSENTVKIVFEITEGTRVAVTRIVFDGATAIAESDLKKEMKTKEDRWWRTNAFLDRTVMEEDLRKIAALYRSEGYIDAKVTGYDTDYSPDGKSVVITIKIDEGAPYVVSGVDWVGASDFARDALRDLTKVEVGKTYRPEDAEKTIRDAYAWYGERGYIHSRIVNVEDVEPGNAVKIEFNVNEDQPAHVGQIHIVGNKRTKEKVIRRELTVKPGDLYRTSDVIASQRQVANLGFFDGPTVEFADNPDKDDVDLVFDVKERQTGRAGVGISSSSEKGITGFLELTEGNLFGNGQFLDLKWEFGKKNTELVLGFTEPWFMDKRLSVGFDVYDTDDKRVYGSLPEDFFKEAFKGDPADSDAVVNSDYVSRSYVVNRERRGADVRVGWPLFGSRSTMLYGKYTLEQFKLTEFADITTNVVVDSVVINTETNSYYRENKGWEWRSGLTSTFVRRTTDRRYHPRLGSYTRFTSDLFGWALGGDVEYQRHVLDTRTYFPVFWKAVLMLRGRGGIVTGFGDPSGVPNDTRFELGGVGVNGVRGYDNRSILPVGQDLYGGRTMLLGSAELKFPITNEAEQVPVYGLFFIDAGNTWMSGEDTHPSDLYWGVGAGVRIELPVLGNLGIDMGYGLDDDKGGEWVVHYQFGLED